MRKALIKCLLVMLVLALSCAVLAGCQGGSRAVRWKDAALEAAFREWLNKPEGEIFAHELSEVEAFIIVGESIFINREVKLAEVYQSDAKPGLVASLEDLTHLHNLARLEVYNTQITSLKGLEGVRKLEQLVLTANSQLSDIGQLKGMAQLRLLSLSNIPVDDIEPLSGLTGLKELYLQGISVQSWGPLAGLTGLTSLTVGPSFNDATLLEKLVSLEYLNLANSAVIDISTLAALQNLKIVSLDNTQVADISPLAGMPRLQRLDVRKTPVPNETTLANVIINR